MSRRPARFTQSDIHRALKAAKQAGVNVVVEMTPDGTIRITPAPAQESRPVPVDSEKVIAL